jgi:hypothetical protein
MPWMGLEPTIPGSERAKTVHALDRSATVTGTPVSTLRNYYYELWKCWYFIIHRSERELHEELVFNQLAIASHVQN